MSLKLDAGKKYRNSSPMYIVVVTQDNGLSETTNFMDGDSVYNKMRTFADSHAKGDVSVHVFTRNWRIAQKTTVCWEEI